MFAIITLSQIEKGDLLHQFGNRSHGFWNPFFKFVTKLGEEYIYVIIVIILIFRKYAYAVMVPILGLLVGVFSWFLKDYFNHPRPLQFYKDLNQIDLIHQLDNFHTMTGFSSYPSGHTFSAFAIYTFFALVSKNKWVSGLCFVLAFLVGISRIYLNQHFLEDVFFGSFLGVSLAIGLYYLSGYLEVKFPKLMTNFKKKTV